MQATPRHVRSARLFQDDLTQGVIPREVSIARFRRGMMALGCGASWRLTSLMGWGLALSLAGLVSIPAVVSAPSSRAIP